MYYPGAFAPNDLQELEKLPLEKIEVTEEEAKAFVCNGVYHEKVAILGGASERILDVFRGKGYHVFVINNFEDVATLFGCYAYTGVPTIISLPKPTELLKGGGSYRCCSLFLD